MGQFEDPQATNNDGLRYQMVVSWGMTKITVMNNGPIRIEGDFTIHDVEGREYGLAGRNVISLCRCGQSENKPFCDGHHKACAFESVCAARELPPPAPAPGLGIKS